MKKIVSVGLLMMSLNSFGNEFQQELRDDAHFNGGYDGLKAYLSSKLIRSANHLNKEGTVYLEFTIDKKGKIGMVQILKGIDSDLDQLAILALNEMPLWQPARNNNGDAIESRLVLPLRIKA